MVNLSSWQQAMRCWNESVRLPFVLHYVYKSKKLIVTMYLLVDL